MATMSKVDCTENSPALVLAIYNKVMLIVCEAVYRGSGWGGPEIPCRILKKALSHVDSHK